MSLVRVAMAGCALFLAGALVGCGGSATTTTGGPPDPDRPDAGVEASKSIMQMQPPGPAGKKSKQH